MPTGPETIPPLALRGMMYLLLGTSALLRRSLRIYEVGGVVASILLALKLAHALGAPVESIFSLDDRPMAGGGH